MLATVTYRRQGKREALNTLAEPLPGFQAEEQPHVAWVVEWSRRITFY